VTDYQWFDVNGRIQQEADRLGLINPLDVLIHFFKERSPVPPAKGLKGFLYRLYHKVRLRTVAMMSRRVERMVNVVFLFPIEPTHVNQMVPIVESLASEGIPSIVVTTRVPIYKSLRAKGIRAYILSGRTTSARSDVFLAEEEIYSRIDGTQDQPVRQLLSRYYPDLLGLTNEMVDLLERTSPSYILVGNDLTWEGRLLARLARRRNCRTGMIQHGLLGHEIVNKYHIVDDFFVYGPAFKAILEQDGLAGVNVVVTGAPYLDNQAHQGADHPHPDIKKQLQLKGRFVLVALSGVGHRTSVENYRLTLEWIDRLIRSHSELEFVIKLHRKERIDAYSLFSSDQKRRIIDRRRGKRLPQSIFDWLKGCSCVITGTSTVAYEAMLCGVPVISVDPLNQFKGVDFIDQRAVELAYSYEELEAALLRVNGKTGMGESFIKGIFAQGDVPARHQIARCITEAIAKSDHRIAK
jgi:DNA-binding transcriptional regulator YdaS (Cro superfamily)